MRLLSWEEREFVRHTATQRASVLGDALVTRYLILVTQSKSKKSKHPGVRLMSLSDGRNVARWNDPKSGKLRQQSMEQLGLTTQRSRQQWAIKKSDELRAAKLEQNLSAMAPKQMSIADGLAKYATAKIVAPRTARSRKVPFEEFAVFCEEVGIERLDQLTPDKLWEWRDRIVADSSRMASTRNVHFAIVRAFLNWVIERDYAPLLPSVKVSSITKKLAAPEEQIEFLRPAAIRKALDAAAKVDAMMPGSLRRAAPFVMALLLSGMRFTELANLTWREVGEDDIELSATRTKNRRGRSVSMRESPTLRQLFEVMREGQTDGLVFGEPAWLSNTWRDYQLRISTIAGVYFTPRTLRRTCGTILANAPGIAGAASIWFAAKRLGHSVAVAEQHYAGVLPGLPADAKTIEDAVGIRDVCEAIVEVARH